MSSKSLKIAIIGAKGYPYVYGGYDTFVKELGERLVQKGVGVTVYNHRSLFKKKPQQVNGINLVYLPAIETKSLTQLSHSFLSFIHACFTDVDIVFAVNPANGPFGILPRLFGKKTIINMDGLEWLRPKWKGLGSVYYRFAAKIATKFYNQIVNDSEEMRKVYLKEFKTDSVVIAYGANIRYSKEPERIKKWGLISNDYYLIVGRMIPDNNCELILRAFIDCNSKKKLVIVGDAPFNDSYAENLKILGSQDQRVIFTGYVTDSDDLAELYHQSFVYIHGHEFGGTNPTLLKALAYGCAILAIDTPFSREVLQENTFGILYRKDVKDLIRWFSYCEFSIDKMAQLKHQARLGLEKKYQWGQVTEKYFELIYKLAN